jgi:alkanesulfonate monooxygenase SsuD/methylene tetrahydromethanopterin reductase-like flavin-dependent oxidoreductase (luciferase family)
VNGTQLSVCIPGAPASLAVDAARLAESHNVNLWIGDPAANAPNADDSYVLTTAAGVAAATSHIRIGVFLGLTGTATPLRAAEDVGVVDQASRGRLELGLVVTGDEESWVVAARQLLRAWREWPAGDRTVAASPRPAQSWMPRLVVGGGAHMAAFATSVSAGVLVVDGDGRMRPQTGPDDRRVVLVVAPDLGPDGVEGWLADDVVGTVRRLRSAADRARADEVLFILPVEPDRLVRDVRALGVVVGPSIRCSAHHVELIAPDSWNWLTRLGHLHHPPE